MIIYFILLIVLANSVFGETAAERSRLQTPLLKHQVKLISTKLDGATYGCSGSLIHPQLILTAGHCLHDVKKTTLIFGLSDGLNTANTRQRTVHRTDMTIHSGYNNTSLKNDIALIKLKSPIQLSNKIGTIALPPKRACASFSGKNVAISGWGATDDSGTPSLLNYTSFRLAKPSDCGRIFGSFDSNSMLCADGSDAGTCQGDSGGPLTMNINGQPTVIGCVSFGGEGCEHNFNRVATCVSNYIDWIRTNSNGLL